MDDRPTHPLRRWRTDIAKLTQGQLGEKLGISAAQVSLIEQGQRGASIEVAAKLFELAGGEVPLSSLVRPTEPQVAAE